MKKLKLEQMEQLEGGSDQVACIAQGLSGAAILMSIAGGAAGFALGPVGFITLGVSIFSFVGSVYSNSRACD